MQIEVVSDDARVGLDTIPIQAPLSRDSVTGTTGVLNFSGRSISAIFSKVNRSVIPRSFFPPFFLLVESFSSVGFDENADNRRERIHCSLFGMHF